MLEPSFCHGSQASVQFQFIVNLVLISKTLLLIRFDSLRRLSIRCALCVRAVARTLSSRPLHAAQLRRSIFHCWAIAELLVLDVRRAWLSQLGTELWNSASSDNKNPIYFKSLRVI